MRVRAGSRLDAGQGWVPPRCGSGLGPASMRVRAGSRLDAGQGWVPPRCGSGLGPASMRVRAGSRLDAGQGWVPPRCGSGLGPASMRVRAGSRLDAGQGWVPPRCRVQFSLYMYALMRTCPFLSLQYIHHRLIHLTPADYDDFVNIIRSARSAFCLTPVGMMQFNDVLQNLKRGKQTKELWQRISLEMATFSP
ncbi:hypothetical protein CgunFtcFv8_016008 [Champsocephalus gunnari]|uniref:ZSWIM4-8 C-terminal domain-containing protein n=1 Tax=Champsocephalus gunnari TaxID=52237 RepID=A0AAN8CPB7_CHAGU|nr:hypothetical protein CgunFtcFv8_016008 [Champsocephalus gunnari]